MGIRGKTTQKFKVTTNSNHQEPIAPNLPDQFTAKAPNKVCTSDSKRLSARSTAVSALDMAVKHRRPPEVVILHSDRGVQYASKAFRKRLKK